MQVNFDNGYSRPQFKRKLNPTEMKAYTKTVKEGLNVLNKDLGFIIHNTSVPSIKGQNTGIGSLLSKAAQFSFIPFLLGHGFSSIQQDPDNQRGSFDPSPYSPISPSKNIYMIPLERLASSEYNNLISERTIKTIDSRVRAKSTSNMDYNDVTRDYDFVLFEAYRNFKSQLEGAEVSPVITNLGKEFDNFKKNRYEEFEPQAFYEIISKEYGKEDWKLWNETDKNLYSANNAETQNRKEQLRNDYAEEIDFFIFKQLIAEREIAFANKRNKEQGINVIGDSPVAYTNVEVWQNKDLFFDDLSLGVEKQRWGFATLKPETLFNEDGSLGKGGELMKKRYEKMFEASPGGVRIDHIIGLVDPYVYVTNDYHLNENNSGRLYSSPNHPLFWKYAKHSDEEYASILEKIVIPAAEKYGIPKENILCEDLGHVTHPVRNVMRRLGLPGMTVTEWGQRGRDANPNNVIMLGCHDNQPFLSWVDSVFNNPDRGSLERKSHRYAEDTIVPGEDFGHYKWQISTDKLKFITAAFTELFTSNVKKIQVFFTDFLGIDKRYNTPGSVDECWRLRVPEDYEELYHENLKKGTAMNVPDAIARAIRSKGYEFIDKNKELLERLDNFTQILKS